MSAPLLKTAGGSGSLLTDAIIPLDKAVVPAGRTGDDADMAGQILYLASRAGAYK
jgi:hypothetical protein